MPQRKAPPARDGSSAGQIGVRIALILVLIAAGAVLLLRQVNPHPEDVSRDQAVRLALGLNGGSGISSDSHLPPVVVYPPVAPVTINLADLGPNTPDPNTLYDRWISGGVDLEGIDSTLSKNEIRAQQEAAQHLPPADGVQQAIAGPTALTPGVEFDSLDYTDCCGGSGGTVPPDPELAVGPQHIIAVVNVAFQIYDPDGDVVAAPRTFANLFSSVAGCNNADDTPTIRSSLFDPNVLYDEAADRFFIAIDRLRANPATGAVYDGSHYCVGVSATNDPTGSWNLYAFPMDGSDVGEVWMDFPHAGIGRDAIYMGGNLFSTGAAFSISYVESRVWAINKSQLYAGQAANIVERSVGDNFTPFPVNLHGYDQGTWPISGPHYFLALPDDDNGSQHKLLSWLNPFANPTPNLNVVSTIDMNAATGVTAGFPLNWPQLGGSAITGNDWRPLDFEYRNGYGWTASTIACNPGGGSVNCVRWAQIQLSNGAVTNAGIWASNDVYRTFPNLAVNHCNDMIIGYTKSSSEMYPAIWLTGRKAEDAPGYLKPEIEQKAGEISYTAFDSAPRRWGDYTGLTIAPDGVTFWYLGQYSKNTGDSNGRWGTYVGAYTFPACSVEPQPTPTPTLTPTPPPTPGPIKANLPAFFKAPPSPTPTPTATPVVAGPQPGYWLATNFGHDFFVRDDRQAVLDFATYFTVQGCPGYYVVTQETAAINNDQFSFTGPHYANGSFTSPTTSQGIAGLSHLYVPGCGYVSSNGDWSWTANWQHSAQAPRPLIAYRVAPPDAGATPDPRLRRLDE